MAWGIGGYGARDTSRDKEAIEALQRGIELGMWLIDTAEMYGVGHLEELVIFNESLAKWLSATSSWFGRGANLSALVVLTWA
ncbi:MAG: aldo/keto reductase [Dehalococcoidia bacterium]|nr:aldo/keto reductase [Dehalococcoidia bacterium]